MSKFNFKRYVFLPLFLLITVFALSKPAYAALDYKITAYYISVNVDQNNVYSISEKITADFSVEKHGIYRDIPVSGYFYRKINNAPLNTKFRAKVSNISVTDENGQPVSYTKSRYGDCMRLKIGSASETVTGQKTYEIRYNYSTGDDGISSFDEFYFNLIGNNWDTTIENISFNIGMPMPFDADRLSITAGPFGSAENSAVEYNVAGDSIKGTVNKILNPGEGLTVRLELPNGYFSNKGESNIGLIILFSSFIIISLLLFFLYGKDDKVYPSVEVRAPEDLNSAETGYIIDGYADQKDVISLIIYWANKGYLTISKDGTLTKLKEADYGMQLYEIHMFNKLFEGRSSVTPEDLKYNFYDTVKSVSSGIKKSFKEPAKRLYTKSGNIARALSYVLAGFSTGIIIGKAAAEYSFSLWSGIISGLIGFSLTIMFAWLIGYFAEKFRTGSKIPIIITIIFYIALLFITAAIIDSGVSCYFAATAALICAITGAYSKKRTKQSNMWLGKLMGLKRFIEMAEKDRIEKLVEDDPSAFYNILPYAYALGVTDKWASKFADIALSPPSWYMYDSYTPFNVFLFTSMLNSNISDYRTNMYAVESSSSDGGFSGGGFSGGGSGGGGGGSW